MGKVSVSKGTIIHRDYETVEKLEIILSGSVKVYSSHMSVTVAPGGILGALETPGTTYTYTYEVLEDSVIYEYAFRRSSDLEKVIASNPKIIANMVSSSTHMYMEAYQSYSKLCNDADSLFHFMEDSYVNYIKLCDKYKVPVQSLSYMDELSQFTPDETVPAWTLQFFNAIRGLSPDIKKELYSSSVYIGVGIIMNSVQNTRAVFSLATQTIDYLLELSSYIISDASGDFFDLYSNLVFHASKNPFSDTTPIEAAVSKLIIFMQGSAFLDKVLIDARVSEYRAKLQDIENMLLSPEPDTSLEKDAYEAIDHSLEAIFDYAEISPEQRLRFRDLLDRYKLLSDKNSTEDKVRTLRRSISDDFYSIYKAAFFKSINDRDIPYVVRMFFNFGYMDEELAGINNAIALYDFVKDMKADPQGNVVTLYEWLVRIYEGKAEPSKNEFDMDYPTYLRDQKNQGYIRAEQEAELLLNRRNKVEFEIANMFTLGNRITFGRISTFCPVFSEHNILRPLSSMRLTPEHIYKAFDAIREVDFSCFYRQALYTNAAIGVQREYIDIEVLPNVILMPNIGSRGSLWQETADSRRDSQGRIMISILHTENVNDIFMRLAGEFRWEMCKKIQGVHWNDVTDPSLTSEYCDYIQFYRKNHELSPDAKEKLKTALQKAKNNYREVFVMDYINWIKYEGHSSPRLNKFARGILFRYCPFPKAVREAVSTNPLYSEHLERYKTKQAQKLHLMDLLFQKISKMGASIPQELITQKDFINN